VSETEDGETDRSLPARAARENPNIGESRRMSRVRRLVMPVVTVAATWSAVALSACHANNPFLVGWVPRTDTVTLYSVADTTSNLYDGFDFVNVARAIIESHAALGTWDVAVGTDSTGTGLVWLAPGAFGLTSSAGVAVAAGKTYDEAKMAFGDSTKYSKVAGVPIAVGVTYIVRTRKVTDAYGNTCPHYGKLEPVDIDVSAGVVHFIFDANPNCGDLRLVP
jgi:hypothetical protein